MNFFRAKIYQKVNSIKNEASLSKILRHIRTIFIAEEQVVCQWLLWFTDPKLKIRHCNSISSCKWWLSDWYTSCCCSNMTTAQLWMNVFSLLVFWSLYFNRHEPVQEDKLKELQSMIFICRLLWILTIIYLIQEINHKYFQYLFQIHSNV